MNSKELEGAKNLIHHCIGIKTGEDVLIVKEKAQDNYYDDSSSRIVEQELKNIGANTSTVVAPLVNGPEDVPDDINSMIEQSDHTIFFSRVGDQLRFSPFAGKGTRTMCYAFNSELLASEFCTLPHDLMSEILGKLEDKLSIASEWRITCPLGTNVGGSCENNVTPSPTSGNFTLFNFPTGTYKPISALSMTGEVVISKWLTPTGYHVYDPDHLILDEPVTATVEKGNIIKFDGDAGLVERITKHYDNVATTLNIDPYVVHSWHAGINPKTFYEQTPTDNLSRWGNLTFSSPRRVHFHTCGAYAPGEIAWNIFDATIYFDDELYWEDGKFVFLEREDIQSLLIKYGHDSDSLKNVHRDRHITLESYSND